MSDRRVERLLETPVLGVFDVECFLPAGAPGEEEHADITQVVFPTRGAFEVHHGRDSVVADVTSAVILGAGDEYRVGHPAAGGDRSTVLVFPPDVVEESLGSGGRRGGVVGPRVQLGTRLLRSALRRAGGEPLAAEEAALLLLHRLCLDLGHAGPSSRPRNRHQRDRVERVRALLASGPGSRWRLDEIARAVHCSPYHLARQFRLLTGESIATYLLRLRLGLALQRLSEGEADLAALAADLGFAHHSHFSARFRSVFGLTPRAARSSLTAGRVEEMRTIVTAEDRAAS